MLIIQLHEETSEELSAARAAERSAVLKREEVQTKIHELSHSNATLRGLNEALRVELSETSVWKQKVKDRDVAIINLEADIKRCQSQVAPELCTLLRLKTLEIHNI